MASNAYAQQIAFRYYTQGDGLSNAVVTCLKQDKTGYILSCGEHGLYIYDGRRFLNLGPVQGLPEGGVVYDLASSQDQRIILRYLHQIYVSRKPLSLTDPPEGLRFDAVVPVYIELDNQQSGQLVPWHGGAAFIGNGRLWYLDLHSTSVRAKIVPLAPILGQPEPTALNTSALVADGQDIWFSRVDGRICRLSQRLTRCVGVKDDLPSVKWLSLIVAPNGHLIARSDLILADVEIGNNHVVTSALPFQSKAALVSWRRMVLNFTPSGELLTQSKDGLMILQTSGWKDLSNANGFPDTPISAVLFDQQKRLWLGSVGSGVLSAKGYGTWQSWDQRDGLTKGLVWQIARHRNGPLWVASDGGVSALMTGGQQLPPYNHFPDPSYAVVTDRFGRVWHSLGATGVTATDVLTGVSKYFHLPPVNQIVQGTDDRLWFITEGGVFVLTNTTALLSKPMPIAGLANRVVGAAMGADGSLWTLDPKHVVHRHNDGSLSTLEFHWPQTDFDPTVIAVQAPNVLWIGGAGGGLYRLTLSDERVATLTQFGSADIQSNSVVSLSIDKRGWVWVGTDRGVSVFNGMRWISITTDDGLISDDMDQNSILADDDGSIWLGTSHGLSHLLEPARLFRQDKLQPVITSVDIGESAYPGRAIPFSRQPLTLKFGILNAPSDTVIRFRYRLDGVDQAWAETSVGFARYPSLPPGHHRFTVIAYDPLKHQVSIPVSVVLRMRVPTWERWPFLVFYATVFIASLFGLLRVRIALLLKQQRQLQHEVERQTRQIRDAQAALFLQATQDGLTKLLTRAEIQRRIDDLIDVVDSNLDLTIGLLDIDHFKRINDAHGHLAGDEVLRELGRRLTAEMRSGEYAGRYGGEEILLALSSSSDNALERIHELELAAFRHVYTIGTYMIDVTCSIGVTQAREEDDWMSLIGRADRALYDAKRAGRNRIVVSTNTGC
ncbi:diguanylate cyclase (plasmid) [Lichenicola cladoniae]|uniref:diguanylate cyclase n=1 Tax=Lichenicola cladoniae TaxID=1484109 RepID=A0A6M8HYP9_9PROT|nr:ligand-binding sensor domain-containing diguanylate cyclase [Lichenicola cladoniae]NPD69590.1 diguanylate cyclase [Acetobacteraceae bacterium]QKE93468.1 diguanylate cyclase [Lichenicola cladoniae]